MSVNELARLLAVELSDPKLRRLPKMVAPPAVKNLGATLRDHIKRMTDRANKLSDGMNKSVDNLHMRLDETEAMQKEIDTAAREIQEAIGTPNGGPLLEEHK